MNTEKRISELEKQLNMESQGNSFDEIIEIDRQMSKEEIQRIMYERYEKSRITSFILIPSNKMERTT